MSFSDVLRPDPGGPLDLVGSAALTLGIEAVAFQTQTSIEIARALDAMPAARIGAVNVLASPILDAARRLLIGQLNRARLPAIYQWPEAAHQGGGADRGLRHVEVLRELTDEGGLPGEEAVAGAES
jgi:putative ABC transport system substrate-binding protein